VKHVHKQHYSGTASLMKVNILISYQNVSSLIV